MQGFLECELGSTRLAVAIGTVVLAVLAIAAVPLVASLVGNAGDVRAKAAVTRLVTQVEACRVTAASYRECDERSELEKDRSVRWGQGAGDAGIVSAASDERAFTAYAVPTRGAHIYVWTSRDSHVSRRVCAHRSVARLERDGCDGSGW